MTTRTLIVLRHAQAAHGSGLPDRERPLTERGELDARRVGEALTGMDLRPDLVLCSPSVRTRRTAALALSGFEGDFTPSSADILFEPVIYEAYFEELLTLIRRSDPETRTLMLIGHNPGVHDLVRELTGWDGDPGFRPGAFAVIEIDDEWAGLDTGRGVIRWSPGDH
ncbi:SixA phosphatase family protein [Streptosporangium lutulentum]|uniref:Phosphohistidine phosphatase n=1 Tax=Streptosporangium lutulentum TaxID=1461250 RepID=A0ABT9QKT2_9ACTN|nr:histidine phosphatase family protein [Streptosporangium lutulentum]MDP9847363.1 phosphohistidine phosphatase [Streptosporangium lutulentum]